MSTSPLVLANTQSQAIQQQQPSPVKRFEFTITKRANDKYRWFIGCNTPDGFIQQMLQRGHYVGGKDGTGLIAATFKPGAHLEQKNLETVTGLILDIDGKFRKVGDDIPAGTRLSDDGKYYYEVIPPEWLLSKVGFRGVAHTSHSHTAELPKYRVILPLREPISPSEFARLWFWVFERTDRKIDPSCKNPDRMFFLPRCTQEAMDAGLPWTRPMFGPLLSMSMVPDDFEIPSEFRYDLTRPAKKQGAHLSLVTSRYAPVDAVKLLECLLDLPIFEWAVAEAEVVSREVWRGLATNIAAAVLEDELAHDAGAKAFHELSECDDARYNYGITEKTFRDALKSAQSPGPMTYKTMKLNGAPDELDEGSAKAPIAHARQVLAARERTCRPVPLALIDNQPSASSSGPPPSLLLASAPALPPAPLPAPLPVLPGTLAGLMVDKILADEPVVKLMLKDPTYATDPYAVFVAAALKDVTQCAPTERADARVLFSSVFAPTPLAGRLDALFDGAPDAAMHYDVLQAAGAPESVCLGDFYGTPAFWALRAVWSGGFHATYGTLAQILRCDARVAGGRLGFNEMVSAVTVNRSALSDTDVSRIRERIERTYNAPSLKPEIVFGVADVHLAVEQVGSESTFHPVREYLGGLAPWDGVARLDDVADVILHAVEDVGPHPVQQDKIQLVEKSRLSRLMTRKFLVGAVARAMKPGCKNDVALILKGAQSFLKSTFFKILFGDQWFIDTSFDIHNPQAAVVFRAAWCVEWAELETMSRARDKEVIKAFLSSSTDAFRPPYGKRMVRYPRHTIFVGTTNKLEFLADETGSRRFWVLDVAERIDIARTAEWRDQLWAEALLAYKAGETWHLSDDDDKLREKLNKEYARTDPWTAGIEMFVEKELRDLTKPWVTPEAVLGDIGITKDRWGHRERDRVCEILKMLGLSSVVRTVKGKQSRVWARVPPKADKTP